MVGHGQDAAAVLHERRGGAGERDEGIDADIVGDAKAFAAGIDEPAIQVRVRGKSDAVHENVQLAVAFAELAEQAGQSRRHATHRT